MLVIDQPDRVISHRTTQQRHASAFLLVERRRTHASSPNELLVKGFCDE